MIHTTQNRNDQSTQRIFLRDASHTFQRVIAEGTNCSPFEAGVISEKAKEVFRLGDYNTDVSMQPGQMLWRAIRESEPPGKPLGECIFETVRLTVHSLEEDLEVFSKFGRSAKRGQQIMRICNEAMDQGALLTQEDLATLLDCDVKTIRTDIQRYQHKHAILVPTRGTKRDIGPGVTHREKVVEMFIKGKDAVSIARDLKHSLKAVERYIDTFCRVVYCQEEMRNNLKTAMVVGVSVPLVNRYLELKDRLFKTKEYQERIEEIERKGSQWWDAQDAKKKSGRKPKRKR